VEENKRKTAKGCLAPAQMLYQWEHFVISFEVQSVRLR